MLCIRMKLNSNVESREISVFEFVKENSRTYAFDEGSRYQFNSRYREHTFQDARGFISAEVSLLAHTPEAHVRRVTGVYSVSGNLGAVFS